MLNTTVYVVHGYTSSSVAEWFPWLKRKLVDIGVHVIVFDMPNPDAPVAAEWDKYLEENIEIPDENTFLIGHSLGCIALLRYLSRQAGDSRIGGVILVSGTNEPLPRYPQMDPFYLIDLDMTKLIKMVSKRLVISAPDDAYVPYKNSCELAKCLEANLITVEGGGHFIGQEGFFEFPQLYDELCAMMICK